MLEGISWLCTQEFVMSVQETILGCQEFNLNQLYAMYPMCCTITPCP